MKIQRMVRNVDMMPLLDVILVVLFVFATIEEGNTESSDQALRTQTSQLQAKEKKVQELIDALASLQAELQSSPSTESFEKLTADRETKKQRIEALEQELEGRKSEVSEKVKSLEKLNKENKRLQAIKVKLENTDKTVSVEHLDRLDSLIDHLLKQNIVTEIEVAGANNACCYRLDPQKNEWRSCGVVPAKPTPAWLSGSETQQLRHDLESTKGGNAITVIRQDGFASDGISFRLQKTIKDTITDITVFDDKVSSLPKVHCSEHTPNPFLEAGRMFKNPEP